MLFIQTNDRQMGAVRRIKREKLLARPAQLKVGPAQDLRVTVTDDKGKPLAGSSVFVYGRYDSRGATIADKHGAAVIRDLVPGEKYNSFAELKGYRRLRYANIPEVGSKRWTGKAEITLQKKR